MNLSHTDSDTSDDTEQVIFSVAVGLGLLSLLLFGLGLIGHLRYQVLFILLIFGIIFSYQETKHWITKCWQKLLKIKLTKRNQSLTIFILFILSLSFLSSLTPCTESDALRYHLAVPQQYLWKHRIVYVPYNAFSNFPFLIESLYTLGLAISGTILPKLIHWLFLVLTAIAIHSFTKRFSPFTNPLVPVAIYISTPFIPIISSWAFIESGLTFYVFIAIYTLCITGRARNKKAETSEKNSNFCPQSTCYLFSIVTGFLLGIKYSMVAVVFFLWSILIIILFYQRKDYKKILNHSILCLILTTGIAIPWYIKNYIYTGNPVYPLGYSIFGGTDWSQFNAEYYTAHAQEKGWLAQANQQNLGYRIIELFQLPWRATMNPPKTAMHPVNFGDWQLGPIYLAFLPLIVYAVICSRKISSHCSEKKNNLTFYLLLLTAIYYFIFWSATYRDNRFLQPILPLLSALIPWSLYQMRIAEKKLGMRYLLFGTLGIMLVYNAIWTVQTVARYHNPLSFIIGMESNEAFLARNLDYYPMFTYVNQKTLPDDRILFIGEYRALYCQRPYYCADFFDTPVILRIIQQSETVDQIKEKLAELQVKYILYNEKELRLYYPYFRQRFKSIAELELFQLFLASPSLLPVYHNPRGMTIFQVQYGQVLEKY
ncbi:MAG: hypothetical protein N3A72_03975 [bacterium]|nr:hypothetical protein [bacterium]